MVAMTMGSPLGYSHDSQQQEKKGYSRLSGRSERVDEQPMPYDFSYQTVDDDGNRQSRREQADGSGTIQGSYGYKNVDGIERHVEYVADDAGFRAIIRTNEPGTDNKDPADVQIQANPVVVKDIKGRSGQRQQVVRSGYQQQQQQQQHEQVHQAKGYEQQGVQLRSPLGQSGDHQIHGYGMQKTRIGNGYQDEQRRRHHAVGLTQSSLVQSGHEQTGNVRGHKSRLNSGYQEQQQQQQSSGYSTQPETQLKSKLFAKQRQGMQLRTGGKSVHSY